MGVIFLSAFRVRGCIEYFVKEDYSIIKVGVCETQKK